MLAWWLVSALGLLEAIQNPCRLYAHKGQWRRGCRDPQADISVFSLQKVQFNLTQTVGDIRRFIRASQPGAPSAAYRLVTAQPRAELKDDSTTISQAGLANSVVRQEM